MSKLNWPKLEPNPYLEIHSPDNVRVRDTRLGIDFVVAAYLAGRSPEGITQDFPSLSLEAVYGVIAYYLGHRKSVDRYLTLCDQREQQVIDAIDGKPGSKLGQRLARLRPLQNAA